jgi:hypothetical protein
MKFNWKATVFLHALIGLIPPTACMLYFDMSIYGHDNLMEFIAYFTGLWSLVAFPLLFAFDDTHIAQNIAFSFAIIIAITINVYLMFLSIRSKKSRYLIFHALLSIFTCAIGQFFLIASVQ